MQLIKTFLILSLFVSSVCFASGSPEVKMQIMKQIAEVSLIDMKTNGEFYHKNIDSQIHYLLGRINTLDECIRLVEDSKDD